MGQSPLSEESDYRTPLLLTNELSKVISKMKTIKLISIPAILIMFSGCDINEDMRSLSSNQGAANARAIAANNGCMGCHAVSNLIVGPGWKKVSQFYLDNPNARNILINKIKAGGKGTWNHETGGESMPGYEGKMAEEDIAVVVDYILSLSQISESNK